jgi:hypothetical protein
MEKTPVDVIVSGIGKLWIDTNCKGYGKSALFQTHSLLSASNQGYEGDFMSKVRLEYDCCEELHVKFNISNLSLNPSFKHTVSHLDDLKIATLRISDVETMIREQEWKTLHTSAHHTHSVLVYICLLLIGLYIMSCF